MEYSIGEFSKITGVTIRALHFYDQKGLLTPEKDPDTGHRKYKYEDLVQLQKITTFKFLGFSLEEIKQLITQDDFYDSLKKQRDLMQKKKEEIDTALNTIEHIISLYEEFGTVDEDIIISGINDVRMRKEQKQWIEENISEQVAHQLYSLHPEQENELAKQFAGIGNRLKTLSIDKEPSDPEVQAVIEEMVSLVNQVIDIDVLLEELNERKANGLEPEPSIKDELLFKNPFSEVEEEFAAEAFQIYLSNRKRGE